MRNVELHVMETNGDVSDGVHAGLLEVEDLNGGECAACSEEIGHIAGTFFPYAVALDDETQWNVCTECASNVLDSTHSTESTDTLEEDGDEDEEFEFFTHDAND
jgi:DNA-directed RNA polymerase subunit RPC12/RpoP